tara:strand:- start:42 stop:821 length:780 start_codon:yes stop_codon:yes gene_type:complete
MILSLISSLLIALPFFLYIFNIGNRARSLVLFFGLIIIFIPSFLFLSKYSVIGSSKEIILINEVNSKIVSNKLITTSDLKRIRNYVPEDQLVIWFEEIIKKSIENDNLDAAELTLRFAEEDFMQSGNETSYYFLFSLLRDKRFPQFATASITLDISMLPQCIILNSIFKVFINDGPLIPLAILQSNSNEIIHKLTNANSPIPGFDISSAFMNESTLRIISKITCKNDDIFEAKRLYKLSKDKVNVAYKIPSNQWLKALK